MLELQRHMLRVLRRPMRVSLLRAPKGTTDSWSKTRAVLGQRRRQLCCRPLLTQQQRQASTPGTVLQTLAMNGYIEPQLERRMRSLIDLRNRIVHRDIDVEPTSADVQLVLSAISETLAADAA